MRNEVIYPRILPYKVGVDEVVGQDYYPFIWIILVALSFSSGIPLALWKVIFL